MNHSLKRDKIIKVFENGALLTANEICGLLPEIDRATIYRNLKTLHSTGILREVSIKKGILSYELNIDSHQHFVCERCEKIIPVDIEMQDLKKILPKGIEFEEFELNLKGKCIECK